MGATVQKMRHVMPEAYALREVRWQLFVTLTFQEELSYRRRIRLVFAFIRKICQRSVPQTHFKKTLWCLRWERNGFGGRGHYHLCIGGLRGDVKGSDIPQYATAWWGQTVRSIADVQIYDDSLDGIGYVLKLPASGRIRAEGFDIHDEELQPTLSKALKYLRR